MKDWLKNIKVLQWIAGILIGISTFLGVTVWTYDGRIEYLKKENIVQDSTIFFQKIEILRLEAKYKDNKDNIENAYDLFHDYNKRIETLEEE